MTTKQAIGCFILLLAWGTAQGTEIPKPETVFGFRPGSEGHLADWRQILDYYKVLAAASDRVMVRTVGTSTRGNPMIVVTISSPANLADLERIRKNNVRLADARRLGDGEAEALVAGGKAIVALLGGIHSLEFAGPLALVETAYSLAASQDPETAAILDQVVIVMVPSVNPDGLQQAVSWYRDISKVGPMPFLQHPYTGEELNHDWFMFTQVETRLVVENVYDAWRPQIVQDLHGMNPNNGCIFVPPYKDPWDPSIDPAIVSAVNTMGSHIAATLIGEGKKGVVVNAIYNPWQLGRYYAHTHGGVRILTESAFAAYADPVDVAPESLQSFPGMGYDAKKPSWNYPAPWLGGTWTLRDSVDYQISATRALLDHAAKNRTYWLRTFHDVLARAASRTQPHAFIVPAPARDCYAVARLLEVLQRGGVEVHRATAPFAAAGRQFGAGSHVILMAQPFSTHAKILLERQDYPWTQTCSGENQARPFGDTAQTLPFLMGVEVVASPDPFKAELERVTGPTTVPGRVEGKGRWYVLGHGIGELKALGLLLKAGAGVRWTREAFVENGQTHPAGSLLVPASHRPQLESLCHDLGIAAQGIAKAPPAFNLRKPRVALYQSWPSAVDEGWTRFVFEREMDVDYVTVHDQALRAGNLGSHFDVVLLPDENADEIFRGYSQRSLIPEEYKGGIGEKGVDSLKAFVSEGGTLVAVGEATALPIKHFPLAVVNDLKKPASESQGKTEPFYCPGAILHGKVATHHPLARGLDDSVALWFSPRSPAFTVTGGTVVVSYDENPLLSGWLAGGDNLKDLAAVVEMPFGKGRVVLIGFRPLFKAESWATYPLLLNSIYTSAMTPQR